MDVRTVSNDKEYKLQDEIKVFVSRDNVPRIDECISRIQERFPAFHIKIYVCENYPHEVERYGIVATPTIVLGETKLVGFDNIDELLERMHNMMKLHNLERNMSQLSRYLIVDRILIGLGFIITVMGIMWLIWLKYS
jgi:hypothetical protein